MKIPADDKERGDYWFHVTTILANILGTTYGALVGWLIVKLFCN